MKKRGATAELTAPAVPAAQETSPLKAAAAAFTAGDRASRELAAWKPRLQSADADMLDEKEVTEARALDLVRNNGIAYGAMQSRKDRIVGNNFRLVLSPDYRALGMDRVALREWARQIEGNFSAWADDPGCFCDAQRKRSFTEMLRDAEASRFLQGEAFLSREFRFMPFSESAYGTCFMLVEPERVEQPSLADPNKVRSGVEVDNWGAPVAYYIRNRHPHDYRDGIADLGEQTWQRVTKYNRYGWLQVIHNFEQQRANQTRGFSQFASIVKRLKMLDRQENVQLELSVIAASLAVVIESQFGANSAMEALGGSPLAQLADYVGAQSEFKKGAPVMFDGVRIPHLFPGEKLTVNQAEPPGESFAAFQEAMLRHAARGLNTSYESLTGDYSKTSYSSARAAMAESWNAVLSAREFGPSRVATQMFRLWLREGIVRGLLPLPPGVSQEDFMARMAMFSRCSWIGAGRSAIDELKSAKANELNLNTNQTTLAAVAADAGLDWEELLEQRAEEKRLIDELGLGMDQEKAAPAAPADPEQDSQQEEAFADEEDQTNG